MSAKYPEKALAWTDVETTGTDATTDLLLEIAVLVTDVHLNLLDEGGYEAVVYHDPQAVAAARERAVPVVQQMHDETGLWDKVSDTQIAKPLDVIDAEVLAYLRRFIDDPRTARLTGNSVRLDLNFVEAYLPQTYAFLHYRMGDMSSVAGVVQWWLDEGFYPKRKRHAAMDDIRESLAEARWLRSRIREGLAPRTAPVRSWLAERLLTDAVLDHLLAAGLPAVDEDALTWKSWEVGAWSMPKAFTGGADRFQMTTALLGEVGSRDALLLVFVEGHLYAYGTPANDWSWGQYVGSALNPFTLGSNGLTVLTRPLD